MSDNKKKLKLKVRRPKLGKISTKSSRRVTPLSNENVVTFDRATSLRSPPMSKKSKSSSPGGFDTGATPIKSKLYKKSHRSKSKKVLSFDTPKAQKSQNKLMTFEDINRTSKSASVTPRIHKKQRSVKRKSQLNINMAESNLPSKVHHHRSEREKDKESKQRLKQKLKSKQKRLHAQTPTTINESDGEFHYSKNIVRKARPRLETKDFEIGNPMAILTDAQTTNMGNDIRRSQPRASSSSLMKKSTKKVKINIKRISNSNITEAVSVKSKSKKSKRKHKHRKDVNEPSINVAEISKLKSLASSPIYSPKPNQTAEELKILEKAAMQRKLHEKQQRKLRMQALQKKNNEKSQRLQIFYEKRDRNWYTFTNIKQYSIANATEAKLDTDTSIKEILRYPKLSKKIAIPDLVFDQERDYSQSKSDGNPILNAFGSQIQEADCVIAFYAIDDQFQGTIAQTDFHQFIRSTLQISIIEWSDLDIEFIFNTILSVYEDNDDDDDTNDLMLSDNSSGNKYLITPNMFIRGLNLTTAQYNIKIYDFYYLLMGCHWYSAELANPSVWYTIDIQTFNKHRKRAHESDSDDDDMGDAENERLIEQQKERFQWLTKYGQKCVSLYGKNRRNKSYLASRHGLLEYQSLISSLMNHSFVARLPTMVVEKKKSKNKKHRTRTVIKYLFSNQDLRSWSSMLKQTIGKLHQWKYEWMQVQVIIGTAKIAVYRPDIYFAEDRSTTIILRECDRILSNFDSKILMQCAIHLLELNIMKCPKSNQESFLIDMSVILKKSTDEDDRPLLSLHQMLLVFLSALDRFTIENKKTWKEIGSVAVFACNYHVSSNMSDDSTSVEKIHEVGAEILYRIYLVAPAIAESILSNDMKSSVSERVRRQLGIDDEDNDLYRSGSVVNSDNNYTKFYEKGDVILERWESVTQYMPFEEQYFYSDASQAENDCEMSPARLWHMMQSVVHTSENDIVLKRAMNKESFVVGLSEVGGQTHLKSKSIRALFNCMPRKQKPWITLKEFVFFVIRNHSAPIQNLYSIKLRELLV